jgi:hypothetical protein
VNMELFDFAVDFAVSLPPEQRAKLRTALEDATAIENLKFALDHFGPEGIARRKEQVQQLKAQGRDGHRIRFLVAVYSPNFSKGEIVTLSAPTALRFIASGEAVLEA